jgi:hypothetical protein
VALTYKQRLFIEYYLGESNGNAADAARKAGYGSPETLGPRLVKKRSVQAAISARIATAAMPANEVLARLSEIATASLGDFIEVQDGNGWTIDLKKAKRGGKLKLLKKLKSGEHGPEIELLSPLDALEKLAKYHGLYIERVELKAKGTQAVRDYLDDESSDQEPDPTP